MNDLEVHTEFPGGFRVGIDRLHRAPGSVGGSRLELAGGVLGLEKFGG